MGAGAPPAVSVYRGSGFANRIRQRSMGTRAAALNYGPGNRLTSHTDTVLAASSPSSLTALHDGAFRREEQAAGGGTRCSVYDASDTFNSDRRRGRRQGGLYPCFGYDAGAHNCQRVGQACEGDRNYPRPEAFAFLGDPPPILAAVSPAKMQPSGRAGRGSRCCRLPASRLRQA